MSQLFLVFQLQCTNCLGHSSFSKLLQMAQGYTDVPIHRFEKHDSNDGRFPPVHKVFLLLCVSSYCLVRHCPHPLSDTRKRSKTGRNALGNCCNCFPQSQLMVCLGSFYDFVYQILHAMAPEGPEI